MDFLLDALTDWLKEMLVGGIMSNLIGDVRQREPAGRGHCDTGGPDPSGLERQYFQHDPESVQLHHGADCWRDPGYRDDAWS